MTWPACIVACLAILTVAVFMHMVLHRLQQIVEGLESLQACVINVEEVGQEIARMYRLVGNANARAASPPHL